MSNVTYMLYETAQVLTS